MGTASGRGGGSLSLGFSFPQERDFLITDPSLSLCTYAVLEEMEI